MTGQKYYSTMLACILGLMILLSAGTSISPAEEAAVGEKPAVIADSGLTTALDEINYPYLTDNDGGATLTFKEGDVTVSFLFSKVEGENLWKLISPIATNDVVQINCYINDNLRGDALKETLSRFVSGVARFQHPLPSSAPVASIENGVPLFDVNTIPEQYRTNESKVMAWLKQNDYYGKKFSLKVMIALVGDKYLMVRLAYDNVDRGTSYPNFLAFPVNFSPLDYADGETYYVTGTLGEDERYMEDGFLNATLRPAK